MLQTDLLKEDILEKPDHIKWMKLAIEQAKLAFQKGEVPVGAVVVKNNQLLSSAHNLKETNNNPTHHAEMLAIQQACKIENNWRLTDTTMYTTLEPCIMCAGAIIHARISNLVFAARDPKAGAVVSLYNLLSDDRLNHSTEFIEGVLQQDSAGLINEFFLKLRAN